MGRYSEDECAVLVAWRNSGAPPKESRGLRLFMRLVTACSKVHPSLVHHCTTVPLYHCTAAERPRRSRGPAHFPRRVYPHWEVATVRTTNSVSPTEQT
eukprot:1187706-Prorocentrum_minimum.AAC.1